MVVTVVAARGRGITSAPTPAKARLGLCAVEHTTHSSDTQKRACSQHIYILYNIYIEGYTGLYTNLALSPPTSQGGCVAVPESHGGGLSGTAAYLLEGSQARSQAPRPGSNGGVEDWKGDEQKLEGTTPGQPSSGTEWPEPRPATILGRSVPCAGQSPHRWACIERLGLPHAIHRASSLFRGHSLHATSFSELAGALHPARDLVPWVRPLPGLPSPSLAPVFFAT